MKLSEAIRLGATMKPQAFGLAYVGGGSCALGAAADAIRRDYFRLFSDNICSEWPDLQVIGECPECGEHVMWSQFALIPHLNDEHFWTRERIADYVELHFEALPLPVESLSSTENMENVR